MMRFVHHTCWHFATHFCQLIEAPCDAYIPQWTGASFFQRMLTCFRLEPWNTSLFANSLKCCAHVVPISSKHCHGCCVIYATCLACQYILSPFSTVLTTHLSYAHNVIPNAPTWTMASHRCHGVSWLPAIKLFDNFFNLTINTKKTLKLRITNPLSGKSIDDRWISIKRTDGRWLPSLTRKKFHVLRPPWSIVLILDCHYIFVPFLNVLLIEGIAVFDIRLNPSRPHLYMIEVRGT